MADTTRIIVGMSGGVDSSVTALRLLQQGYVVEGLFMKNWDEDDDAEYCSAAADLKDARQVCKRLGIPLHTVNFAQEYWVSVFDNFLEEHKAGRTPNPDVLCNRDIKFRVFLEHALKLGGTAIATGHYARLRPCSDGRYELLRGVDTQKDQSYFLYMLNQSQLSYSLFPVGELPKPTVRQLAQSAGLVTYDKKDSTGICFVGERPFKTFLQEFLPDQPGEIVTTDGEIIGQHDGLMYYTLGQRKGLHIGGRRDSNGEPWYVVDKDMPNNRLIIGQGHNHPRLFSQLLFAEQLHWISGSAPELPYRCTAKTRYRQADQGCELVTLDNGQLVVRFEKPQRAVTPGQSVVFYQSDVCLGGGIIDRVNER